MNPSLFDAWCCLGNCIWKKGDLISAKNCFTLALSKVSLSDQTLILFILAYSSIVNNNNNNHTNKEPAEMYGSQLLRYLFFTAGSRQKDTLSIVNA